MSFTDVQRDTHIHRIRLSDSWDMVYGGSSTVRQNASETESTGHCAGRERDQMERPKELSERKECGKLAGFTFALF